MFYKLYKTKKLEDCDFDKQVIMSLFDCDIILVKQNIGQIIKNKAITEICPSKYSVYRLISNLCYNTELFKKYEIKDVNNSDVYLYLYERSNYTQFMLSLLSHYKQLYSVSVEDRQGNEISLCSDGRVLIDDNNIQNNIYIFEEFLREEIV